jgi:4-hydroxy-3-polyprenylbenzoate decarboxylase
MKIIIAISGASGSVYGIRLVKELAKEEVFLIVSNAAKKVIAYECPKEFNEIKDKVKIYSEDDIEAGIASSSFGTDAMVICPCSMKTLAAISIGYADNLITRCADIMIRERKKLILVPREMPLSEIQLENMLKLSRIGVTIMPACPGWYHKPKKLDEIINFVIGKVLDQLEIKNKLYKRWEGV